jgi:hypothetical protein
MLITDHERSRFCAYLRQQIESGKSLIPQMEKLPMGHMLAERERQRVAACLIVLQGLESAVPFSISEDSKREEPSDAE